MIFSFVEGYIKIPWLNINLNIVKKDPKIIMLHAPLNISKLKSEYGWTENHITSNSTSTSTTAIICHEICSQHHTCPPGLYIIYIS
jgi:hypothetical protein